MVYRFLYLYLCLCIDHTRRTRRTTTAILATTVVVATIVVVAPVKNVLNWILGVEIVEKKRPAESRHIQLICWVYKIFKMI